MDNATVVITALGVVGTVARWFYSRKRVKTDLGADVPRMSVHDSLHFLLKRSESHGRRLIDLEQAKSDQEEVNQEILRRLDQGRWKR